MRSSHEGAIMKDLVGEAIGIDDGGSPNKNFQSASKGWILLKVIFN